MTDYQEVENSKTGVQFNFGGERSRKANEGAVREDLSPLLKKLTARLLRINRQGGTLSRLLMLRKAYPEIKANENFLKLQDSLEGEAAAGC